ncbi:MAG: fatty acid desaturase family protein [Pirellulales bacterium]
MTHVHHTEVDRSELPTHLKIGLVTRFFYAASCAIAFLLLFVLIGKIAAHYADLKWYSLLAIPLGMILADFLSGVIHWSADTWGSESMPILGKRLLHPFRVHHVNPADFLRRQFIDTNGDVAFLAIPFLLAALKIPLTSPTMLSMALFITSFAAVGLMTNQIHQWAHMRSALWPISWLQRFGIILSHEAHQQHHQPPYAQNYCIATGWCNRPLMAINFFTRMERLITRITGVHPRVDEVQFSASLTQDMRQP